MKKTLLIASAAIALCCGCAGLGLYMLLRPWTPPKVALDGESVADFLAIKLYRFGDEDLIVWDTDGNLNAFSPQFHRLWTHQPPSKLIDVDVQKESVASLDTSGEVRIFDARTGKVRRTLKVQAPVDEYNSPMGVKLSPDGNQVALVDRDQHLRRWDVSSGRELSNVALKGTWRAKVTGFDAMGHVVYCDGDSISYAFDTATQSLKEKPGFIQLRGLRDGSLLAVKDGKSLVFTSSSGSEIWRQNLRAIWSFLPNQEETLATVSMPGNLLWTGGRSALVNLESGDVEMELNHPDAPMPALAWVQDLKIVGGHEGLVLVYGKQSDPIAILRGPESDVQQILITSTYLYTIEKSGRCHRWRIDELLKLTAH